MNLDLGLLISTLTVAASALIWSGKQEGRITILEKTETLRTAFQDTQYKDLKDHVVRIEDKLDRVLTKGEYHAD